MLTEVAAIRGHGEGTWFERGKAKRKPGEKPVFVSAVTMRDGRRASRTTHSRDEAKAELAELLRLRDAGAPITGRIRLGDFLERWVASDHDLAPATRRKHESIIRVHLIPELGHVRLSELSPEDVSRALHVFLRAELDPQTVRHLRATLRRCLADALRDGLVTRNAAGLSRAPKLLARERTILDAAQARLLIESTRGTRYGPLWTILVTTGLRISEALGLAWSDVDFGTVSGGNDGVVGSVSDVRAGGRSRNQHGPRGVGAAPSVLRGPSLTVRHQLARENGEWVRRPPKTAKGRRTIPLTPLGVDALRAQRAMQREWRFDDGTAREVGGARLVSQDQSDEGVVLAASGSRRSARESASSEPRHRGRAAQSEMGRLGSVVPIDGLVFTTERGRPIHGENLLPKLRADLAAAGLPRVTIHDLRHSCATVLFAAGVPLEVISDILGHSTTRVTADLYRHRVPELSRAAAERMQEALG